MSIKIYEYNNCSTCKKALKYLDNLDLKYEKIAIVDQPPSLKELKLMLGYIKNKGGNFKNLFNTSGQLYREKNMSEKIKNGLTETEALDLLSKNGKLIKRPFVLNDKNGSVGFKLEEWAKVFK